MMANELYMPNLAETFINASNAGAAARRNKLAAQWAVEDRQKQNELSQQQQQSAAEQADVQYAYAASENALRSKDPYATIIGMAKIDPKVQSFFQHSGIDLNNRDAVLPALQQVNAWAASKLGKAQAAPELKSFKSNENVYQIDPRSGQPMGGPVISARPEIGNVNPSDFTPESVAKFERSGNRAELVRYTPPEKPISPYQQAQIDMAERRLSSLEENRNRPKNLPVGALRIIDEAKQSLGAVNESMMLVDKAIQTIGSGKVNLGAVSNMTSRARNFMGVSSDSSRAYSDIQQTLEKLRNNYLLLAKGVQTEGDAARAWNSEIGESAQNDNRLAMQQLQKAKALIARTAEMQNNRIDTVYSNYGAEPVQGTAQQPARPTATATGPNGQKLGLINGQWVPLNGQ